MHHLFLFTEEKKEEEKKEESEEESDDDMGFGEFLFRVDWANSLIYKIRSIQNPSNKSGQCS